MPYDTRDRSAVACEDFGMHPSVSAKSNRLAMQNALSEGGLVTLMRGGTYKLDVDNFTVPDATMFAVGPGVSFEVGGLETLLGSVFVHRVESVAADTLGQRHTDTSWSDATTGESDPALYSLEIPAYSIGPNSTMEVDALITVPSSATTKTIRVRFGGTVLANVNLSTHVAYRFNLQLANRNSLSAQIISPNNTTSFSTFASSAVQTSTVDFSTDQTLTITGQWGTSGAGSNNITLNSVIVKHWYGA